MAMAEMSEHRREVHLYAEPWNCSPCRIGIAYPWFVTSILSHGSYNANAESLSMTGLTQ